MEPKSPELNQPVAPVEVSPGSSPETTPNYQPEQRVERSPEHANTASPQVSPPLPTPVVQLPTPVTQSAGDDSTVVADDTPTVAADEDLIEKEWVDKAKKIILETKDDPFRREREVGRLQTDYLKKRYGKELGSSGD